MTHHSYKYVDGHALMRRPEQATARFAKNRQGQPYGLTSLCPLPPLPILPFKCVSEFKSSNKLWLIYLQLLSHCSHFNLAEMSAFNSVPPCPEILPCFHRAWLLQLYWQGTERGSLRSPTGSKSPHNRTIQVSCTLIYGSRRFCEHFLFAGNMVAFLNLISSASLEVAVR